VKRVIINLIPAVFFVLFPPHSRGGEGTGSVIMVEGVSAGRQAAPVAALREIGERVNGLSFSIYDGKYIQLGAAAPALSLDTQDKKTIDLRKLRSGLFKAVIRISASSDFLESARSLRERTVRGEGEITEADLAAARALARADALEKAIRAAVEEQFPGDTAPHVLTGRVLFLGTVEERVRGGSYLLVARVKVSLRHP